VSDPLPARISRKALKASAGSRLVGLLPHRRPHAEQVFEALLADDGLTKDQVAPAERTLRS
jgi:hypothetical protein